MDTAATQGPTAALIKLHELLSTLNTNNIPDLAFWKLEVQDIQRQLFSWEHIFTVDDLRWARLTLSRILTGGNLSTEFYIYDYLKRNYRVVVADDGTPTIEPATEALRAAEAERMFLSVVPQLAKTTVFCCIPLTYRRQVQEIADAANEINVPYQRHAQFVREMLNEQAEIYENLDESFFARHTCSVAICKHKKYRQGGTRTQAFLSENEVTHPLQQTVPNYTLLSNSQFPQNNTIAQASQANTQALQASHPNGQASTSSNNADNADVAPAIPLVGELEVQLALLPRNLVLELFGSTDPSEVLSRL